MPGNQPEGRFGNEKLVAVLTMVPPPGLLPRMIAARKIRPDSPDRRSFHNTRTSEASRPYNCSFRETSATAAALTNLPNYTLGDAVEKD